MKKLIVFLVICCLSKVASAQAPGVEIEQPEHGLFHAHVINEGKKLKEAGRLLGTTQINSQLISASNAFVALPSPKKLRMKPSSIYKLAKESMVRVGWMYLCKNCNNWHFNGAGGYPIARHGIVATCHHLVSTEGNTNIKEGYLIAVDSNNKVYPVEKVVAKSKTLDAAILQVSGLNMKPVALSADVVPGDAVYCYSDPLSIHGFFSQGIANRFFWNRPNSAPKSTPDDIKRLRLNVSCAWAPGSSGSGIFDECGNIVGHVATWGVLQPDVPSPASGDEKQSGKSGTDSQKTPVPRKTTPTPGFQFYEAIPAQGIKMLCDGPKK